MPQVKAQLLRRNMIEETLMNPFITQAQEAAKQWGELSTSFFQEQAKLFQAPLATPTATPDPSAAMAGFVKATAQADEFMVKAVKLMDVQAAQLMDAALQDNAAKEQLKPVVDAYKTASQTVVAAVEQLAQARKALLDKTTGA
ncbi:hypothetical protein [Azohydromonas lata]|uniref:Phasin domain-containing protein n=1 Tax=Azohydromonas lata TaxID=45677 RepID=A0ABU5IEI0_9BURK|nr:hypothetical protein [Azohydromonas lata]MDZ5457517.1 hypothetical protein [Azohydromonas lata]